MRSQGKLSAGGKLAQVAVRPFLWAWASPWTIVGIGVGLIGCLSGGKLRVVRGAVEFSGGFVTWLLRRLPNSPMAMTVGHTILGLTPKDLEVARDHEHVHVRQYERWGPLFVPVYLGLSALLSLRGKNSYRDNPFEIEAYAISDPNTVRRNQEEGV